MRVETGTRPNSSADYKATDGRCNVNDNAASEVLGTKVVQPTVRAPKPVRDRIVPAVH